MVYGCAPQYLQNNINTNVMEQVNVSWRFFWPGWEWYVVPCFISVQPDGKVLIFLASRAKASAGV